ncbi:MAG: hypothetical protein ACI85K_003636 [Hyphomicrobiaceae bacterium]|jgi:hypothetical protein
MLFLVQAPYEHEALQSCLGELPAGEPVVCTGYSTQGFGGYSMA